MEDQKTGPNLVAVIISYLLAQGTKLAVLLLHLESSLQMAVGWDNFIKCQICALWVEMQAQEIHTRRLQKEAYLWVCNLIQHLLELTHCQWLYPNAMVHMMVKGGLRIAQHDTTLMRIEECLQIDPTDLLVEDRELLEANSDKLAHSPTLDKLE
jgi:hypothetical protein